LRNAEVIRQWRILKRIEAGRYTTAQDLADEHGVTERTIRRDIEALQEAGFPLYDERSEGRKVWRLIEGYRQRLTQTFTLAELSALYFSKNLMAFLGGSPFATDLEAAFGKIKEALPARSLPYLERIQELFLARPDPWKDYSKKKEVIAELVDAVLHQRRKVLRQRHVVLRQRRKELCQQRAALHRRAAAQPRPTLPTARAGTPLRTKCSTISIGLGRGSIRHGL